MTYGTGNLVYKKGLGNLCKFIQRVLGKLMRKTKQKQKWASKLVKRKRMEKTKRKVDAAPGLPGRSPIPVLFRPKGA